MRAGGSPSYIEAPYTLRGPIFAGVWNLVADGIIAGSNVRSITIQFEMRWRRKGAGDDSGDLVILSREHTFVRNVDQPFSAVPYEDRVQGVAAAAEPGDSLILRITAQNGDTGAFYIPNGDGQNAQGRIPHLDLPQ